MNNKPDIPSTNLTLLGRNTEMDMARDIPATRFLMKLKTLAANTEWKTPNTPYRLSPT